MTFEEFSEKWEKFRLEREIPAEAFVAEGYGFVDDLYDFFKKLNGVQND